MLDFASLISSLTEQTKRRPYMQPEALPLPSEQATNEIAMGAGQAFGKLTGQLMGGGGGYNTVDTTSIDEMARQQPIIRGGHKGFGLGDSALMGNADNTAEQYGDRAKGLISMGRGRRYGGPVNEDEPYVVGEEGMEIIVPKKDGEVIPLRAEEVISANALPQDPSQGQPMQGSPLGLGEEQLRATAQGIADEPANADSLQPSTVNLGSLLIDPAQRQQSPVYGVNKTLDDDIGIQQDALRSAMDAPIEKQSPWKDIGAKLIQGADAFFNGNRKPIEGWGKLKHDQAIQRAERKLNPLLGMKKNEQEIAFRDVQRQNVIEDNRRQRTAAEQKVLQDARNYELKAKLADWKIEDRAKFYEWEDVKQKAKEKNDTRNYELAVRKQAELEKNNLRVDEDRDTGLEIKRDVANSNAAAKTNTLNFNKEKLDKTLSAADEKTKSTLAAKSLDVWTKANPNATPEQLAAAQAAINKTVYNK